MKPVVQDKRVFSPQKYYEIDTFLEQKNRANGQLNQ